MHRFVFIHFFSAILIASGAVGCSPSNGEGNPDSRSSGNTDDGNDDGGARDTERTSQDEADASASAVEDDAGAQIRETQDAGVSANEACSACEYFEECIDGQCQLNGESLWDVRLNTVEVVNVNEGGTGYDGGDNLPDPFAVVTAGGGGTDPRPRDSMPNTLAADFHGLPVLLNVPARFLMSGDLCVHVLDDDTNNPDDDMGESCVRLSEVTGGTVTITRPDSWGFQRVTLSVFPNGTY